jgi:hypothetical protein
MTYQDDPNNPYRASYPMTTETSYTGWAVGGLVILAVIMAIITFTGSSTDRTGTAANPPATPTTTGSATRDALPPKSTTAPAPSSSVPPGQSRN